MKNAVKNFENASENLSSITKSLKNSNDKGYIEKTLYNLQETSSNFAFSSKNFGSFTTNLNNESSILINCILKNLNITVNNINKIINDDFNNLIYKYDEDYLIINNDKMEIISFIKLKELLDKNNEEEN